MSAVDYVGGFFFGYYFDSGVENCAEGLIKNGVSFRPDTANR